MTGQGPRLSPDQQADQTKITVAEASETGAKIGGWAARQAYRQGQAHPDPQAAYDRAFDAAYLGDGEGKQFAGAALDGWEAGVQAHQELADDLMNRPESERRAGPRPESTREVTRRAAPAGPRAELYADTPAEPDRHAPGPFAGSPMPPDRDALRTQAARDTHVASPRGWWANQPTPQPEQQREPEAG